MTATLGPYELRGRLGSGAMAVVWRAWDPILEREVAIKEPVRSPGMTEGMARELAERFVYEGKVAARLSHPGIVTIFAADTFDGRPAIVMELLRGHALSVLIDRDRLPLPAALSIMNQLLDALGYAHSLGVIHRDVKPDNIFVAEDGRVRLTDFGVAHLSRLDVFGDKVIVGTPGYMAPEQIRAETADARADIFSLGAVAFEMLTMRNPFGATDGLDKVSIMARTTSGAAVQFPSRATVPREIQAVILRALSESPESRYSSAAEMREALRSAATGVPASGSGAVAELVGRSGALPGEVSLSDTTMEARTAGLEAPGSKSWIFAVVGIVVAVALALVAALAGGGAGVGVLAGVVGVMGLVGWMMSDRAAHLRSAEGLGGADFLGGLVARSADFGAPLQEVVELSVQGPNDSRIDRVALPCVIGRGLEADVVVADERASRQHALLERRNGEIWVRDLDSRNGTFLDGAAVHGEALLQDGSVVRVGATEIAVLQISAGMGGLL